MTCTKTMSLGAYLLGALDPAERADFEAHLHRCDACRGELVRLSPLPGLLHRVRVEDFEDAVEPTEADLLVVSEPEPRRGVWAKRKVLLSAAAAVVVLAAAGLVGFEVLRQEPASTPPSVSWSATDSASGVRADVRLIDRSWGTEVKIKLRDVPPGKPCKLVVRGRDGNREVAGWWGSGGQDEEIPGSTSIDRSSISRVEVVTDDDIVLVDVPAPA
ncbi:zf-HC2 domain-containing protein [Actinokineospora sp. PR83]|uniref:anti-sigma factor family protein n=1 Tax=Actinokineospora sp. PR83 TaxID=2884908 RepID=UPI0027E1EF3B|nr:zf-HC2 domain-containing protein [Actinokineospora sp. PR83]MCG8917508.1 zf-HC2 domain-containing protein [Actinokineospora sp. PR83]